MSFKPFFIHSHREPGGFSGNSSRGFTAYVYPVENEQKLGISFAFCNKKDQFIKSEGRRVAMNSTLRKDINKRHLPKVLRHAATEVVGLDVEFGYFDYSLKHVV